MGARTASHYLVAAHQGERDRWLEQFQQAVAVVVRVTGGQSGANRQQERTLRREVWLPVVDNLRTLFLAPPSEVRLLLQRIQELEATLLSLLLSLDRRNAVSPQPVPHRRHHQRSQRSGKA